jgi:hypothetical protein
MGTHSLKLCIASLGVGLDSWRVRPCVSTTRKRVQGDPIAWGYAEYQQALESTTRPHA